MEFVKTITESGLIFQGLISEPKEKTDTAILHIHGMAGNFWENGFIKTMIKEYPKNSITFLTVENHGSEILRMVGKKDGEVALIGNAQENFEDCIEDITAWISFLLERGYKNIYLQGHSLGCSKVAYYAKDSKKEVRGLILISASDMLGLVLNKKVCPNYEKLLDEANKLKESGRGNDFLSEKLWGEYKLSANTYLNFFQKNSNTAIFNYYNPELGFERFKQIKIPILSILGTKDDGILTDPYESNKLLEQNKNKECNFKGVVLEGAEHSFEGFEKEIIINAVVFIKKG